ncbi:MAG: cupin domain-containing protein [Bacillota bacterium]
MGTNFIKNIEFSKALELSPLVTYQDGQVVSRTLAQNEAMNMTLFAFAVGEGLSSHTAPGDAMVYIMDGQAEVTVGEEKIIARKGQVVILPAHVPHALDAQEKFKMLLVVVKQ